MTEAAAAAESTSAAILSAVAEINAATAEMGAGAAAAATELSATDAEIGASVNAAAADTVAANERITASYTAVATGISEDGGVIATAVGESAAAAQAAADKIVASTVAEADAFAAMRDKIAADLAAVDAAETEAATANEALGAKMAGTSAEMGIGATAAGTFKASLSDTASKVGLTSGQLLGLGAAAAGVAAVSVKMAGDFQQNTEKLVTSANETQQNLDMVRQGILNMAGSVGYSATQLSDAMYKVESGGQHGADGLKVLQAAAEGAKTENADLTTVADALTSAMTDYHAPASAAADITSKLVEATASGKMTFEELAGSLSSILPVASANHVALNDILGDMASMTMHGMSAQQASQNLADAIRHMTAPTQVQSKELATLGINATQLSQDLGSKGLSGTINEIGAAIQSRMGPGSTQVILNLNQALQALPPSVQKLGQAVLNGSMSYKDFTTQAKALDPIAYSQAKSFATLASGMHTIGTESKSGAEVYQSYSGAMQKAMGTATGMNVALMIGGENAKNTATAIGDVSSATAQADGHVKGWAEIQGNFNQKLSQAKDGLEAMAISIGEKLLPVVTPIIGAIATFTQWISQNKAAAIVLAAVIGGVVVVAIGAVVVALYSMASAVLAVEVAGAPLIVIVLAVIAVVAALAAIAYLVISNWGAISGFFVGLWDTVKGAFDSAINWIGDRLGDVGKFFSDMWGKVTGAFKTAWGFISHIWDDIVGGFQNADATIGPAVDGISRFFLTLGATVRKVVDFFVNLPGEIGSALSSLWTTITTPFITAWNAVVAFFSQSPQQIGEELGHAVGAIIRKGIEIMVGLKDAFVRGWQVIVAWFEALPGRIANFFVSAGTWLLNEGIAIITGLRDAFVRGWQVIVAWFVALPGRIANFFTTAGTWLLQKGTELLTGLKNGIVSAWNAVVAWFVALPGRVQAFLASAKTWLLQKGIDLITGTQDGIVIAWINVVAWFKALPGNIANFFSNAGQWLLNAGQNILEGLWNGFTGFISTIWNGITSFISGFINGFKSGLGISSPSTIFLEIGQNVVQGLWNGVVNIWNGFIGFVSGLPQTIINLFAAAGSWLINAGRSLVEGLWNGIQQLASWLWNQITSWASGLVKAALSALGVHSPSVHMHEAGMQMVIGLANGIQDHAHIAAAAAEDMARQVLSAARTGSTFSGTMASTYSMLGGDGASLTGMGGMAAQTAVASALGGTAGGGELGSAAAPVTIQVTVQGSVLSENDLAQTVQQVLLRHNIRNTSNATSYGGFA